MVVLLSRLPATECIKFCHRVVDGLCGREPPRRSEHSSTWSPEEWLQLLDSLNAFYRRAVGSDSSEEEVLGGLADVGSSHAEALLSVLRARREEIHRALLDRTNSISSATLQDFDWQLKLSLSSDKISSLHTPSAQPQSGCEGGRSPALRHHGDEPRGVKHTHQFPRGRQQGGAAVEMMDRLWRNHPTKTQDYRKSSRCLSGCHEV
ncbi:COMM domain containing protein 8 [Dissostichus eleginoides]|uniref:COMM domain containing protein 8 n=1 Tax=Dissostichus eleginoides TaxID=100907 RepID=A0AAD9C492_DISEL|nr:COMM domain containing protein 8 [Dissostichus eleginoides]